MKHNSDHIILQAAYAKWYLLDCISYQIIINSENGKKSIKSAFAVLI